MSSLTPSVSLSVKKRTPVHREPWLDGGVPCTERAIDGSVLPLSFRKGMAQQGHQDLHVE